MRGFVLTARAVIVVVVAGCGGPELPPPVDPDDAGRQLRSALDSWKNGDSHDSLASREPPIVFNEPLWRDGGKLLSYELGPVELHGRQGRCTVTLAFQNKEGKQSERRIGYQIDTVPRIVIVRETLGP
jgi:hypothetical protein